MDPAALTDFFHQLPVWTLVLTRLASFLATAPVIGGPYMPFTARALLCVAITMIIAPGIHAGMKTPPGPDLAFIGLLVQETLIGLCMGWILSLMVLGVRMGGDLINRYAGFQAAENFDPSADFGEGPFGDILHIALVLIILATDSHLGMIASLVDSFRQVPIGTLELHPATVDLVGREVQQLNVTAAIVSMPVLAAIMAVTLAEGVLVRAVPQINIMHISFAVKIGVSILVMSACMPSMVAFMGTLVHGITGTAMAVMRTL